MTSRQTEPDSSSILGWKILFMKPIDGDLYGYWFGSSTWIFHSLSGQSELLRGTCPPANGAACVRLGDRPARRTLVWPVKAHVELLHIVVDERDLRDQHWSGLRGLTS